MSEVTDLVIPVLQKLQADMSDVKKDLHHIKVCVSSMKENVGGMNRRLDRLDTKFDRLEKHLGLIEVKGPLRRPVNLVVECTCIPM
jgi:predicted nuclease with TOPRIM domain